MKMKPDNGKLGDVQVLNCSAVEFISKCAHILEISIYIMDDLGGLFVVAKIVCFPAICNVRFFGCFKLFGINFRFRTLKPKYCPPQEHGTSLDIKLLQTMYIVQHTITSVAMNYAFYLSASNIDIHEVSSCAFASDEPGRALHLHEISIDLLLNSNKLSVAIFQLYILNAQCTIAHAHPMRTERKMCFDSGERKESVTA